MTNMRNQYGGLPLVAIVAIVVVIIGVAIFYFMMIMGGGKEFANASDAGALNVAKLALHRPFVRLSDVNTDATKFYLGQGDLDPDTKKKEDINLYNINKIWGSALIAGLNYEAMKAQAIKAGGQPSEKAKQNAKAMCDAASAIALRLKTRLTNSDDLKDGFKAFASANSTRMFGHKSSEEAIIDGWEVAYCDTGSASDIKIDDKQLPKGLPQDKKDALQRVNGNYMPGYKEILLDPDAGLRYYFSTLPPFSKPHLVSQLQFTAAKTVPVSGTSPFVPNTFQVKASLMVQREGGQDAALTNVASYGEAGPMDAGPKTTMDNAFIRISNFKGLGVPGVKLPVLNNPKKGNLSVIPKVGLSDIFVFNGFHTVEYANTQMLLARTNGTSPGPDLISASMTDPPWIVVDPKTSKAVEATHPGGNHLAWGNAGFIIDTVKQTLAKGVMPSGDTDKDGNNHFGCLVEGIPNTIVPAPPENSSSSSTSTTMLPISHKRTIALNRSNHRHRIAMGPSIHSGGGGTSDTTSTSSFDFAGAIARLKDLLDPKNVKKVDTDNLTAETTAGNAAFNATVSRWAGENLPSGTHLDVLQPYGGSVHPHLWTQAPLVLMKVESKDDCQVSAAMGNSGICNVGDDPSNIYQYAFNMKTGPNCFSGMAHLGESRNGVNLGATPYRNPPVFAQVGTVKEFVYPESGTDKGVNSSFAYMMSTYTTDVGGNSFDDVKTKLFGSGGSLNSPNAESELGLIKALRSRIITNLCQMDSDQFGNWGDSDLKAFLTDKNNPLLTMGDSAYLFLDTNGKLVCALESKVKDYNADIDQLITSMETGILNDYGVIASADGRPYGERIDENTNRAPDGPFNSEENTVGYLGPRFITHEKQYNQPGDWGFTQPFTNEASKVSTLGGGGAADLRWWAMYVMTPCSGSGGLLCDLNLREFFNQPDTLHGRNNNADTRSPAPCDLVAGTAHGSRPIDCPCECYPDVKGAIMPNTDKNRVQTAMSPGNAKSGKTVQRHAGINAQPHTGATTTTNQTCHPNCSHTGPC